MALDKLVTSFNGQDEHDMFVLEIVRKYALLDSVHDELSGRC